ncbi:hypothetical protein A4X13_0g9384, partial [Tilletia indica]
MQHAKHPYVIKISCPATSGIVAAVTSFLAEHGCYISEMAQFDDEVSGSFFMRAVFRFNEGFVGEIQQIEDGFAEVAERFE